ncbi:MAG: DUF167 domain-containing protein [Prochloraceae cyanobacterium]|nr:DUF167 domain-containing protein [Prochloraceae cyanobacterium]
MKISVKVKPNSKQQKIEKSVDGSLIVRLKSPPVDGKANKELISLLSQKYNIAKSQISIESGLYSKNKLIKINLPSSE